VTTWPSGSYAGSESRRTVRRSATKVESGGEQILSDSEQRELDALPSRLAGRSLPPISGLLATDQEGIAAVWERHEPPVDLPGDVIWDIAGDAHVLRRVTDEDEQAGSHNQQN
jgi:hypothetical protein